jgi:hypothetical protein
VTVLGLVAASVAYAGFAARTTNSGDSVKAGTVSLAANDAGASMLSLTHAALGASTTSCIRISYGGSLAAGVHEYGSVSGSLAPYLTLTVTRGSGAGTFGSCTGFTADAQNYIGAGSGVIFSGKLSTYPGAYAAGIVDPADGGAGASSYGAESWTTGETHDYRFQVSVDNNSSAIGLSASAAFTWEARNS